MKRSTWIAGAATLLVAGGSLARTRAAQYPVEHTDAQWLAQLGPARFDILRRSGTEPANSSPLLNEHRQGIYVCAGCDLRIFSSATKYDSGDGWPSFTHPFPNTVLTSVDHQLIEERTEVHCRRCGGHLGHIFDDGPPPLHTRYCIDGLALFFRPGKSS